MQQTYSYILIPNFSPHFCKLTHEQNHTLIICKYLWNDWPSPLSLLSVKRGIPFGARAIVRATAGNSALSANRQTVMVLALVFSLKKTFLHIHQIVPTIKHRQVYSIVYRLKDGRGPSSTHVIMLSCTR